LHLVGSTAVGGRFAVRPIAVALLFSCFLLAAAPGAHAEEGPRCGARGIPWVRLDEVPFDAVFRVQLIAQLRAGLSARHIELCTTEGGSPAQLDAASEISLIEAEGPALTVAVSDAITGKRLARDLDLRRIPPDARPLTVALAVEELLRASWVELTLRDQPEGAPAVPREISESVSAALGPPPHDRPNSAQAALVSPTGEHTAWELGAGFAGERFGGGLAQVGVDVVGRISPIFPLVLHAGLGLRSGVSIPAADGVVRWTGVNAAVGAQVALTPRAARFAVHLLGGGLLTRATFSGDPHADARGHDESATAVYVNAGLRGAIRLTPSFGLSLAGGVGVPLHTVQVLDGDSRVAGLSGPLLFSQVGGWWRFR
jgi:hypothetical protein